MPKCFFVCGPESSGNKMIAKILIDNGVFGDADPIQRLDNGFQVAPKDKDVVIIRSFPHGSRDSMVRGFAERARLGQVKRIQ